VLKGCWTGTCDEHIQWPYGLVSFMMLGTVRRRRHSDCDGLPLPKNGTVVVIGSPSNRSKADDPPPCPAGTVALKALEIGVSGRKSGPAGTFEDSLPREVLCECSIPDLLE